MKEKGYMMSNKGIVLFLVFLLLFISYTSFVSAAENNETGFSEIEDKNHELSFNNSIENDHVCELNNEDRYENIIEFNQGDKIPIIIDNPVDGNITVLIDNNWYGTWNFSKSNTILIPTYNSASFYNNSIKNIDVGTHEISLIFNFNFSYYIDADISIDDDSTLNFEFFNTTNKNFSNTYIYNSLINILKKEKTIYISEFSNVISFYQFDPYKVTIENYINWDKKNYSFGTIVSNKSEIVYKSDIDCEDFDYTYTDEGYGFLPKIGFYNLTVVNFADGTMDSRIFEVFKYYPEFNMTYLINQYNDVTVIIKPNNILYTTNATINMDNNMETILINLNSEIYNITFEKLKSGVHFMSIYCPEDDFSEQYNYNITFEIKDSSHINKLPDTISIVPDDISFIMFPNLVLFSDGAFLSSNSDCGIINFQDIIIVNNSGSGEYNFDGNSNITGESMSVGYGDSVDSSLSESSSNVKSYEISKKSASKSIDNFLTKLGLTIVSCMSFMVGYIRFEKVNK